MFNGKKERELLGELEKIKQQNEKKRAVLKKICEEKDNAVSHFERTAASHEKMEANVGQMKEGLSQMAELAENSETSVSDIHSAVIQINNTVESFDANHSVFLEQMKQQNEKLMEMLEENKKISAPVENITEVPAALQSEYEDMHQILEEMQDFSKSMSVLSLNAAIEAGRLGEAGSHFITAAEEVRNFADKYDDAARVLSEQLKQSENQILELQKQVEQLKQSAREHTMSMGKFAAGYMQNLTSYESNQLEIHGVISDSLVSKSDALLESGRKTIRMKDDMMLQMEHVLEELGEQKEAVKQLKEQDEKLRSSAAKELG